MEKNLEYYMGLPYAVTLKPYADGGFFAKVEEAGVGHSIASSKVASTRFRLS